MSPVGSWNVFLKTQRSLKGPWINRFVFLFGTRKGMRNKHCVFSRIRVCFSFIKKRSCRGHRWSPVDLMCSSTSWCWKKTSSSPSIHLLPPTHSQRGFFQTKDAQLAPILPVEYDVYLLIQPPLAWQLSLRCDSTRTHSMFYIYILFLRIRI